MPTNLSRGDEIGYTLMPYKYDMPLDQNLAQTPDDSVLGYITTNPDTFERKFTYTESGTPVEAPNHWSLPLLKEFPMVEQKGPWILYACSPEDVPSAYNHLLVTGHALHIYNWDTWRVEGKKATVAVVTSYEIY
jgi:hypothetical protein